MTLSRSALLVAAAIMIIAGVAVNIGDSLSICRIAFGLYILTDVIGRREASS